MNLKKIIFCALALTISIMSLTACGSPSGSSSSNSERSGESEGTSSGGSEGTTSGGSEGTSTGGGALTNSITVTVGTGTAPTYTWTGGNAKEVSITKGTLKAWAVSCSTDCLASPVTHGTTPAGSTASGTSTVLTAGTSYTVTVTRSTGATGTKTFTP